MNETGYMGVGVALGIILGLMMDNLALGIAMGIAIGAGMMGYGKQDNENSQSNDQ